MVLGAAWCPLSKTMEINRAIREIKSSNDLRKDFEIKWKKISPAKKQFYLKLIDYFFDNDDLHFRALIVPDKTKLQHAAFSQSHDDWYYKMYFDMLKLILSPGARYSIYIDIKDTRSAHKVAKLHDVLSNNLYDFSRQIIERVQMVRSHEVEILQLADLLIGAISYINRGLTTSSAKQAIVERIRQRSHYSLTRSTLMREDKINLFRWHALEGNE